MVCARVWGCVILFRFRVFLVFNIINWFFHFWYVILFPHTITYQQKFFKNLVTIRLSAIQNCGKGTQKFKHTSNAYTVYVSAFFSTRESVFQRGKHVTTGEQAVFNDFALFQLFLLTLIMKFKNNVQKFTNCSQTVRNYIPRLSYHNHTIITSHHSRALIIKRSL